MTTGRINQIDIRETHSVCVRLNRQCTGQLSCVICVMKIYFHFAPA